MEIDERLEKALPTLSPQMQRAARYLLDNLSTAAFYDSTQLAALCRVSSATMSRLVRQLGLQDHRELKEQLRIFAYAGKPHAQPLPVDSMGRHLATEIVNLQAVYAQIDNADLDHAAKLIHEARRVVVVGRNSSYPIALHFQGQLALARDGVFVAPQPGYMGLDQLAALQPEDVVILIGHPLRLRSFDRMLTELKRRRIPSIVIADRSGRKYAQRATIYFEVALEAVGSLASYTSAMSLTCLLENAVISLDVAGAQEQHDSAKAWHDVLDE